MMPQQTDTMTIFSANTQRCVARALYDNLAESPDELAFRRGDTLTVLEQNTGGLEGWWLCALRGRQGICPGNRLRLLAGVYDTGQVSPTTPVGHSTPTPGGDTLDVTSLQRQGKRRSWHVHSNKVITPQRCGDVYLYDLPPNRCSPISSDSMSRQTSPAPHHLQTTLGHDPDSYDIPRPAVPINYDTPRNCRSRNSPLPNSVSPIRRDSDSYDIPKPLGLLHQQQMTPSSSASSLTADSMSSSNRSSLANMPEYDVPRPRGTQLILQQIPQQLYDVPPSNPHPKELPLELGSALDSLSRLQTEVTATISKLLSFVTPTWRLKDKLEGTVMEIKLSVVRLKTSLHDLAEFGEGALGNAARAHDKGIAAKLRPLVKALRDADKLILEASTTLDAQGWSAQTLSRLEEPTSRQSNAAQMPDSLDQLVACARALTEDVRQTTSFIQGNSTLLFKRAPSPQQATNNNNSGEWMEDYDYVNLESRESVDKKNAEIRDALPIELKKSFDVVVKEAESAAVADNKSDSKMNPNDRQLLTFYAAQTVTHSGHLTHAIDAFLQTVEHNQPPKVFLAHGKFVVLSAHRLVHIGDTVHRNVTKSNVRERVLGCANTLSEALATTVNKTKRAALQFPSVTAVQEMVDAVVDISHLARDLKISMVQAAQSP